MSTFMKFMSFVGLIAVVVMIATHSIIMSDAAKVVLDVFGAVKSQ